MKAAMLPLSKRSMNLVAIGCAQATAQQGLRIPEDISIVGFGNILIERAFSGSLDDCSPAKFRLEPPQWNQCSKSCWDAGIESNAFPPNCKFAPAAASLLLHTL